MYNHFQQNIDEGLKQLAAKQGSGGLPKSPQTYTVPSDITPPSPDLAAAKMLEDQIVTAGQIEAEAKKLGQGKHSNNE
jgi:hypothetical protein